VRPRADQYKIPRVERDIFYIEDQDVSAKDTISEPQV
jgi:hypothetical protein